MGDNNTKSGYVIFLSSKTYCCPECYGYWSGKNYTFDGDLCPITDSVIAKRTKVYTTEARAKKGLESCLNREYTFVTGGRVEPYTEPKDTLDGVTISAG